MEDIHKLMYKVAQHSVTSDSDTTRLQCRQVSIPPYAHSPVLESVSMQAVVHYFMDYPLGKRLKRILDFYVCNLRYGNMRSCDAM